MHVSAVTDTQETMREVALEAGGRAFVNQNEIKNSVALAVGDAGASYTLGYYPQDHRWNGKYRSIKVKVDRGRVVARYRRGYFAIDPKQVKDRDSDRQVAATLAMVTPATLVAFSARVKSPAEDESKLGIDLLVDANTLSMEDTKPQSVQGQVWPITYKGLLSRKDGNPENCQNAFLRLFLPLPFRTYAGCPGRLWRSLIFGSAKIYLRSPPGPAVSPRPQATTSEHSPVPI